MIHPESPTEVISKKRTFDIAFATTQATIESLLPQVSEVLKSVKACWEWCASGLAQYLEAEPSGSEVVPKSIQVKKPVRRRHKTKETHTDEARQARRAHRRKKRTTEDDTAELAKSSNRQESPCPLRQNETPVLKHSLLPGPAPSTASIPPSSTSSIYSGSLRRSASSRLQRDALRTMYTRALESRYHSDSTLRSSHLLSRSRASPSMHKQLLSTSLKATLPRRYALQSRTNRDVANVLNRITPHQSRISKERRFHDLDISEKSTPDASPVSAYRSPGGPVPSPAPSHNPFKHARGKKIVERTEEQSLDDLIAQLRKEHPHQYEWQKIDREKAARNEEIARKRGLLRPKRIKIPVDTAKRVEKVFHGHSSTEEILAQKFNQEIRVKDLSTLRKTAWLNDEVINFYMNLISDRAKAEQQLKIHAFNTFFYSKLISGGYKDVRRWAKKAKVDIAQCDLVLVPVHLGVHWCMAVINARESRFEYWDSLQGGPGQVFSALREYMKNEAPTVDISKWDNWISDAGPRQSNGYDCGVFACQTAESISRLMSPDFSQEEMPELRKRMAASILDATIY